LYVYIKTTCKKKRNLIKALKHKGFSEQTGKLQAGWQASERERRVEGDFLLLYKAK